VQAGELQALIEDAGVVVTRVGSDEIYAHCPRPERHPRGDSRASWSINVATGVHYCFSCGYRGTLRQLIADLTGEVPLDLDESVSLASTRRHIENVKKRDEAPATELEPEIFISEFQLETYRAVPYVECEKRQLHTTSVDMFGVRWDHRKDCWIIPVRGFDGKLLGWQEKSPRHFKNVPTGMEKSKSLFGLDWFRGDRAVLVESPLDVIRLDTVGVDGGLASFGAHVSQEQMDMLIDTALTIVLALDNDAAGRSSMRQIIDKYRDRVRLKIVRYLRTDPKDVGEMSRSQIHRLLASAVTPGLQRYVHR
jgi:DNA primase